MGFVKILSLMLFIGCAQTRDPASTGPDPVARDSIALGNVKASATKNISAQKMCFDVDLLMKGVPKDSAQPTNWTVAWIDKDDRYHLLSWSNRGPASEPQGGKQVMSYGQFNEWSNKFTTCANQVNPANFKALVLTPKALPFGDDKSLNLQWK